MNDRRLGRLAKLSLGAVLTLGAVLLLTRCLLPKTVEGPAGLCGWLGVNVVGLGVITAADGTDSVGTWYHVFAEGVTDANQASREAIANRVVADQPGFARVLEAAPEELRPALNRLYALISDPVASAAHHADPDVLDDVAAVDAQGCDFLRGP